MFNFLDVYDYLSNDKVTLKLTEKNYGDDDILPFYYYDIHNKDGIPVGKISIRIGNNFHSYYNGHIGYQINEEYRGNNYSFYASKLVTEVAKAHNMKKIFMTCKRSNIASIKIMEKLGAVKIEIAKIPEECFFYFNGIEDYCIYSLLL